jgi:ceramide glucosyltransferase
MAFLTLLLTLLVAAGTGFSCWCAACTWRFFAAKAPPASPHGPGVSVLIPVCGIDENTPATWLSFCNQNYDNYEVLFGVMDPNDPAYPALLAATADLGDRARVLLCRQALGINYQISNLVHLLREARHDVIVITDSDMLVQPHYLATVTAPLQNPKTGLVTCAYAASSPNGLGEAIASLGRCVDFLPQVLVARQFDGQMKFALGATLATRKDVLRAIGGLEMILDRIGSDYQIGRMAHEAGYRVELSQYVVENGGDERVKAVLRRELRWARTIRMSRGPQYYGLIVSHGAMFCLPLLAVTQGAPWALGLCAAAICARYLQALVAIRGTGCTGLLRWLWALPLRDVFTFSIWTYSLLGNDVYWRGRRLRLERGGRLYDLEGAYPAPPEQSGAPGSS